MEDTHLSSRPSSVLCVTSSDWSPCCVRGPPAPEGVPPVPWSLVWKPWPLAEGLLEGASAPCRNADPGGGGVDTAQTLHVAPGYGHCSPHGFWDLFWQEATKLPKNTPEEGDR